MSVLSDLKDRIIAKIYQNTQQKVTGQAMQDSLLDMIDTMGVSVSQNIETGHTDINIGSNSYPVASVEEVNQLVKKVDGETIPIYRDYTSEGKSLYVNLSDINHVAGDTIYFRYDGGIGNLYFYSATNTGLSAILTIVQDSETEGHTTVLPAVDTITRIYILHDDTRFPEGSTISFIMGTSTTPGLIDKVADLEQADIALTERVKATEDVIHGTYWDYVSEGEDLYINLSNINKVPGDTVYFKYNGGLENLLIYSGTVSGLSTQLQIIADSEDSGHFVILPVTELIVKFAIIHDDTRFPEGTVFSVFMEEGIEDKISSINTELKDAENAIEDLEIKIDGGHHTYSYDGGSSISIPLSDIGHQYGETIRFEYNGDFNELVIYWCTPTSIGDILPITKDGETTGSITIPNQDNATRIYIASSINSFPSGTTIVFYGVESNGLVNEVSSLQSGKQEKLTSGVNIKTINNVSILGPGNINISGSGSADTHLVNAADFGFLPSNTSADNVANLQSILVGGNITVYVTVPGTYYLNATILIDSNTEIIFGKGVVLKKVDYTGYTGYAQVFRNRGAATRTIDENIIIRGLSIDANNSEDINGLGTSCYGLRAHLGFMCIKGLKIFDYTIVNLGNYCYGLQINDAENVIISGFNISGIKDGIHISSIKDFVVRDGVLAVSDDGIALNAGDWVASNCIDGPIRNGVIENIKDIAGDSLGNFIRLHNAAWTNWQSGMIIQRGDKVISNGNLYKADCAFNDVAPYRYRSTHQPTYDSYVGVQDFGEVDIDNRAPSQTLRWILVKKNVSYYTADVQDVVLRNLTAQNERRFCVASTDGKTSVYSRCVYDETDSQSPTLPYSSYPFDRVKFENCDLSKSTEVFNYVPLVRFSITMEYFRNSKHGFSLENANANLPSKISLSSFDFTKNEDASDIITGANIRVLVKDCEQDGAISNTTSGSMVSNVPISSIPATPQTGDVIIQSGAIKCYDGTNWN